MLTKHLHFWTTYPPLHVNIDKERPLKAIWPKSQDILPVYSLPVCDNPEPCQIACLTYDTLQETQKRWLQIVYPEIVWTRLAISDRLFCQKLPN